MKTILEASPRPNQTRNIGRNASGGIGRTNSITGSAARRSGTQIPASDIHGFAEFDQEGVVIRELRGVARSGARLTAHGTIVPPSPGAEVRLHVRVEDAPIVSEQLREALGPDRRQILDALFNRQRHEELLELGLVLDPAAAERLGDERDAVATRLAELATAATEDELAGLRRRAAAIERQLEAPAFRFGGLESFEWVPLIESVRLVKKGSGRRRTFT